MNEKVLVIDGAMVSRSPHVKVCLDILQRGGVDYDVIGWNRRNDELSDIPTNFFIYNHPTNDHYPPYKKIFEIYNFYKFAVDVIRKGNYQRIIIFEIANSLFFYWFLKKHYSKKYILDIRDYSPFCKYWLGNHYLNKLIRNSYRTVISSEGFKSWLPKGYDYVISHNVNTELFKVYEGACIEVFHKPIRLLTIGNIRDPYTNCEFLKAFRNDSNFRLYFVGDGLAQPTIQKCSEDNKINNVEFYGHYLKHEEPGFYKDADLINCCMDDSMVGRYLMSNRIYLSVLMRKPIICLSGSYQSSVVKQYNLGVVVTQISNLKNEVNDYIKSIDINQYEQGCSNFLKKVFEEQERYYLEILKFAKNR